MRNFLILVALLCPMFSFSQSAFPTGYEWVVPRSSQQASVYQKLGVTDIEVIYSRPYLKGRDVWNEPRIAPYGKVWRAGANEATIFSVSTDVEVMGKELKAGKYAFFIQPEKEGPWKVIFNKIYEQWGAFTHDPTQDALVVEVEPQAAPNREALEFSFPILEEEQTSLSVHWAEVQLLISIAVDISATSKQAVNATFDWQAAFFAAQHFLDNEDPEEALRWINASIAMQENFSNLNQKFNAYEMMGSVEEAKEVAKYIIGLTEGKTDRRSVSFRNRMNEKLKELGR